MLKVVTSPMPHPPPPRVLVKASWLKREGNLGKSEKGEKDVKSHELCPS